LLQQLVRALDEKKVGDLRVLKMGPKSTITDYIVLATGTSEPHLRALRIEVERVLDAAKQPIAGMEVGTYGSGWTVVDAYQIMTHLFTPEQRANYALEKLWKDAETLNVADLIEAPKVVKSSKKTAAKKVITKKTVAKKTPVGKTTRKSPVKKSSPVKKTPAPSKKVPVKKKNK
jgi:ribosome-associated protein